MWNWLVYAALLAGAVAILAALLFLAVRSLGAWRDFKRLRRHVAKELDRLADAGERLADSAARASDTTRLEERVDGLRATLARYAVLREAADEVAGTLGRVTALVPRK
jgi:hypothetical protein